MKSPGGWGDYRDGSEMRRRLLHLLVGLAALAAVTSAVASTSALPKTLLVAVSGGGSVTSSPKGIVCPPRCRGRFRAGAVVRLTARPRAGWRFARWLRACSGTRTSCLVKMNASRVATAVFAKLPQPPPPAPIGTRANPIPFGQPAPLGNGWTLRVTQYYPDATAMVLAANPFNDPPPAGSLYVMVAVSGTYNGAGSSHLDSGFTLRAVGAANVAYTTFTNSCGVLPAPNLDLDDPEVFSGGTVSGNAACWTVPSSDVSSLVMFSNPLSTSIQVFFALH
jgi:Divergent InlB B-repeat domain